MHTKLQTTQHQLPLQILPLNNSTLKVSYIIKIGKLHSIQFILAFIIKKIHWCRVYIYTCYELRSREHDHQASRGCNLCLTWMGPLVSDINKKEATN